VVSAAGRGFAAGATKKPRRQRAAAPRPPTPEPPRPPALDRWGLPAEPEDEDAPRDIGARKVSLAGPPVSVREAGAALAHARAHPVDLADPKLTALHLDPPIYRVAGRAKIEAGPRRRCGDAIVRKPEIRVVAAARSTDSCPRGSASGAWATRARRTPPMHPPWTVTELIVDGPKQPAVV